MLTDNLLTIAWMILEIFQNFPIKDDMNKHLYIDNEGLLIAEV